MYRPIVAFSIFALAATLAAGQETTPRLEWELGASAYRFDNFFQAPDGADEQDVDATRVGGRLGYQLQPDRPLVLYATADFTAYQDDLDDSTSVGAGLESEAGRHAWHLGLLNRWDQPVFDVGDEFDRADVLQARGSYGYRLTDAWEVSGLGEWTRQEFDLTPSKDNDRYSAGGAIRYRGWGYGFSPEVGLEIGERDAQDPDEDHDQRDIWLKLRSAPTPALYLSLRYRYRTRDYSIDDPLAGNFGREDDRISWTLSARYRLTRWLALDLYYDYLDADSTKSSRIFTTQIFSLGVTVGRF